MNKFGTRTSGADNYFLDVASRLTGHGIEVAYLCMRPSDVPADASVFEVPDVEFHGHRSPAEQLSAARRVLWSREGADTMQKALRVFRPDVVHLHNYAHQLSSSVIASARRAGVPTVATAHDYKFVCPAYTAVRDGRPCFRCAGQNPTHCIGGRCLHGSLSWSTVAAAESALVRAGRAKRVPELILAPSQYMADRLAASWLSRAGVHVELLRNPIGWTERVESWPARSCRGIYVGRLSSEKGLDVMIRAAARSGVGITVVGDGPQREVLEQLAADLRAPVQFAGFLRGEALEREWERAGFFVMTSTWPENAPLALLEGMVRGLPALLTDVGGLPELINAYGGGSLVPPGDVEATAVQLSAFSVGAVGPANVGDLARDLSWHSHLGGLTAHYEEVVARAN